LLVEDVSGTEAIFHFLLIGWKLFFSIIPPVHMGGGIPAFFIALTLIGLITAIVGEVAELLGCVLSLDP
jgi:solute carrier family 8 (sodium/calcium exchanger)